MFGKCTRILMFKWVMLVVIIGALAYAGVWIIGGNFPQSDTIMLNASDTADTPLEIPRWVDLLVVMVPIAVLAWAVFDFGFLKEKWDDRDEDGDLGFALGFGIFAGLCGSFVIAGTGLLGMAIGTASSALLMFIFAGLACEAPVATYVSVLFATVTLWALLTLYQGTVSGLVNFAGALVIGTAVYALCVGATLAIVYGGEALKRFMTTCKYDQADS